MSKYLNVTMFGLPYKPLLYKLMNLIINRFIYGDPKRKQSQWYFIKTRPQLRGQNSVVIRLEDWE